MTDLVDPNPERSARLARLFGEGPRYFGKPWGPAIDEPWRMIPTPVGNACCECGELIAVDDLGIVMSEIIQVADPDADESDVLARVVVQHRECFMFAILGSPACQHRACTCATDGPELRRQRAREALVHWEAQRLIAFEGKPARVLACERCGARMFLGEEDCRVCGLGGQA